KRLNIETIKQENTSFIKENTDIEKIIQRVNENKKKYGFESTTEEKEKKESDNSNIKSKSDTQIIEILKKQIDTLNEKIEKQESRHETTIEFYRKELQERSKLLENQQILALESNKKIQKLENQLEEERQLNYSFDKSTNDRENFDVQEASYTSDSVNTDQYQKEEKKPEVQPKDITENQQDDLFNQNDKDIAIEETQTKKGFWSRLFGG
ncbi:DUF536 domain-containing protein, partial [Xylophilus sp. Kf1]|nr:DUF536 domain-containing protein [Xylophilus sp. Kf1]